MGKRIFIQFLLASLCFSIPAMAQKNVLVFQSDFGLKDGAVAAMKGVAVGVSPELRIYDLTHDIPAFNIWEAAYRLHQSASYWPAGTVFVSVVDPGVGSDRKPVVMKSKSGHFFVTPDNGTLTLVAEDLGLAEVRIIDETRNRLPNSSGSYTFHGRDVFAYTAARLASGAISFEQVGFLTNGIVKLNYQKATNAGGVISGTIDILDIQYGNVWTNIDSKLLQSAGIRPGDLLKVVINEGATERYRGTVPLANTFADVDEGKPLGYFNSLMNFSLAVNMGDFAKTFGVSSGPEWRISIQKEKK
jgi:S-adenosylmethionine hydrolase